MSVLQDENYSWTECIKQFIIQQAGCYLDWFSKKSSTSDLLCHNLSSFHRLQEAFLMIQRASIENLTSGFKCYQSCSKKEHIVWKVEEIDLSWHTDWVSEV